MKYKGEAQCDLCENAQCIEEGTLCICKIRGIVSPDDMCRKFVFDPLKLKVSVPKLPSFSPLAQFSKKGL